MRLTLPYIIGQAAEARHPACTSADGMPRLGGVDPLGLRELNFNMMNDVLPGLNNVGRHIRPFVVVAWAARQARRLLERSGAQPASQHAVRDFIDRIEVLYAWSHFMTRSNTELPGRQVLGAFLDRRSYDFSGDEWETFKAARRNSTALTAAINYGPAIKALKWAGPVAGASDAWASSGLFDEALDAFEAGFAGELKHPAFSKLGAVKVKRADVERWADLWDMDDPSEEEQSAFASVLCGELAENARRDTLDLIQAVCEEDPDIEWDDLRAAMAQVSGGSGHEARILWRRLQVRQAFRYALEAWFYWCLQSLVPGPRSSAQLVEAFRDQKRGWARSSKPGAWLTPPGENCPVALIAGIRGGLETGAGLPEAISRTIAFCLSEAAGETPGRGRSDRLPLWRARAEAEAWRNAVPEVFITHMMETWLFAQHAYWSSSRSLADARANGKVILRLRVTLDEGGWRLTSRGATGSMPYPTADRLETAWHLASECGVV